MQPVRVAPSLHVISSLGKKGAAWNVRVNRGGSGVPWVREKWGFRSSVSSIQHFLDLRKRCLPKPNIRFIFKILHNLDYPCHNSLPPEWVIRSHRQRHFCSVSAGWGPWALLRNRWNSVTAASWYMASGVMPLVQPPAAACAPGAGSPGERAVASCAAPSVWQLACCLSPSLSLGEEWGGALLLMCSLLLVENGGHVYRFHLLPWACLLLWIRIVTFLWSTSEHLPISHLRKPTWAWCAPEMV